MRPYSVSQQVYRHELYPTLPYQIHSIGSKLQKAPHPSPSHPPSPQLKLPPSQSYLTALTHPPTFLLSFPPFPILFHSAVLFTRRSYPSFFFFLFSSFFFLY